MFYKFFSQRQRGKQVPDVLQYDNLPVEFRNQCYYIASDICDAIEFGLSKTLIEGYCREKGSRFFRFNRVHNLGEIKSLFSQCVDKMEDSDFLDLIDYMYHCLYSFVTRQDAFVYLLPATVKSINKAFAELNDRFKQHNLGYEVTSGVLVRIDSRAVHAQYVKPALQLLCDEEFAGAEDEYRKAFEARRAGNNKDAILNAGKCFESVLKTICEKKKYPFNPQKDTANTLLNILKAQGFFPEYLESHLNGIITTLQSGAPTVRNKVAGHGQGSEITDAPDCLVDYVLGLVAVNSVLLVKLYKESK